MVAGRIARVDVFDDMEQAEPHWRALERARALCTPYQRYEFLGLWKRHVDADAGFTPFIVTGFDAIGTPLFLLPLGRRSLGPWKVVDLLGGKHANFNMGLWRRDVATTIGADDLRAVLKRLVGSADLVILLNQSLTWGGTTNAAARKKLRKKERALAGFGAVRFERASNSDQVHRVLDAFFKQKSARIQLLGVPDVFAAAEVRRFIEAAATERFSGGNALLELYALSVDDIIVATLGGIVGDDRFCAMFNSIIAGRYAVESPGEQLIVNLVRTCCERRLDTFDLGIGDAHYMNLFCGDAEPLFDSVFPLSPAGRLLTPAASLVESGKRAIKQHAMLW